jgi:hypothetical protein
MFVKGSNDFKPLRTVVDLVEMPPEKIMLMPPPVPPVKDKSGNKVRNKATGYGSNVVS